MALIKCPECGREISDKAVSCPGCGCPVTSNSVCIEVTCENGKLIIDNERLQIINSKSQCVVSDTIYNYRILFNGIVSGAYAIVFSHPNLNSSYGCRVNRDNYENALEIVDLFVKNGLKINGLSYLKAFRYKNEEQKMRKMQEKIQMQQNLQTISNAFGGENVARCPKCRSTSISYQDKISVGRAIVGGTVAGAQGAVLGGLTGKKGYAVCLKCGKRWKI